MANSFLLTLLGTDTKYANKTEGTKVRVETLSFLHDAAVAKDITVSVKEHKYSGEQPGTNTKAILDGPSTTAGNVYDIIGLATIAIIEQIAQGKTTINIQAHSRGACEAILVSHEIQRLIETATHVNEGDKLTRENFANSSNPTTRSYLSTGTKKPKWIDEILKNPSLVENLKKTTVNIFNIDPVPGDSAKLSMLHTVWSWSPFGYAAGIALATARAALGLHRILPKDISKFQISDFPWNDERFYNLPACVANYTQAIPEFEESACFNSILPKPIDTTTKVDKIIFGGNHATASGCMGFQTSEKDIPVKVNIDGETREFDTSTSQELIACKIAEFHVLTSKLQYNLEQESCIEKTIEQYPKEWEKFKLTSLKEILSIFFRSSPKERKTIYLQMYNKMAENWPGYKAMADRHYHFGKDGRSPVENGSGRTFRDGGGAAVQGADLEYRLDEKGKLIFVCAEHAELALSEQFELINIEELDDEANKILADAERVTPGVTEAFKEIYKIAIAIEAAPTDKQSKFSTYLANEENKVKVLSALNKYFDILGKSEQLIGSNVFDKILAKTGELASKHSKDETVADESGELMVVVEHIQTEVIREIAYNLQDILSKTISKAWISYLERTLNYVEKFEYSECINALCDRKADPALLPFWRIKCDLENIVTNCKLLLAIKNDLEKYPFTVNYKATVDNMLGLLNYIMVKQQERLLKVLELNCVKEEFIKKYNIRIDTDIQNDSVQFSALIKEISEKLNPINPLSHGACAAAASTDIPNPQEAEQEQALEPIPGVESQPVQTVSSFFGFFFESMRDASMNTMAYVSGALKIR